MKNPVILFGGSFDPIHLGHMAIIEKITKLADPYKFILIPCKQSMFKDPPLFSAANRMKFIKIACKKISCQKILISDYEINNPEPSYTFNTLLHFRAIYGKNTPFILIVGSDAFQDFNKWYRSSEIKLLTNILVIDRNNQQSATKWCDFKNIVGEVKFLNIGQYPQASSEIKKLIAKKDWCSLSGLLYDEVISAMRQLLKT